MHVTLQLQGLAQPTGSGEAQWLERPQLRSLKKFEDVETLRSAETMGEHKLEMRRPESLACYLATRNQHLYSSSKNEGFTGIVLQPLTTHLIVACVWRNVLIIFAQPAPACVYPTPRHHN